MEGERAAVIPLFNYGPSIDDLRAASEAETGLPAPKQPQWSHVLPIAAE